MEPPSLGIESRLRHARELLAKGAASEAETLTLELLRQAPQSVEALLLLAAASQRLEKPERAVLSLEQALSFEPDSPVLWAQLGALHAARSHWNDAQRAYAQAVKLAPEEVSARYALGVAQLAAQRPRTAAATGAALLRDFPEALESRLLDGDVAMALGEGDRARAAYAAALDLDPTCTDAWFHLVELATPGAQDARAKGFADAAARPDLSLADRANIEFGQARIAERERRFDAAFEHYSRANRAQRQAQVARGLAYDADRSTRHFASVASHYPRESFRHPLPALPIALRPVFVVGMPRSGTSLVEQILAAHPQVAAGGELSAAQICESQFLRARAEHRFEWPAGAGGEAERQLLLQARERYVEMLFENGLDAEYVTDKLPGNFLSLGFLRTLFPDALIVHCVRDPVATCWSIFTANLGSHAPSYTSLPDLAHDYRLYRQLMAHWKQVLGPPMVEVRYEDLVGEPEREIRKLLAECGLAWDARCLDFHLAEHAVTTASAVQVRQPIYNSSLQRWKPYESKLGALASLREPSL